MHHGTLSTPSTGNIREAGECLRGEQVPSTHVQTIGQALALGSVAEKAKCALTFDSSS